MGTEYRVYWKRRDREPKSRVYKTLRGARKRILLLGDEPWLAIGRTADELYCCDGSFCSCEGGSVREFMLEARSSMPTLEFARIERREVSEWEAMGDG